MNRHTPGPWSRMNATDIFSDRGADSGDGYTADSSDGWHIADCSVGKTFSNGEEVELGWDVKVANANLIAAAPCLLKSLEDVLELFAPGDQQMMRVLVAARSAISKARGES